MYRGREPVNWPLDLQQGPQVQVADSNASKIRMGNLNGSLLKELKIRIFD